MAAGRTRKAVDAALKDAPDGWRKTLARVLADALDVEPNASMARELRAVMTEIAESQKPEVSSVADDLRARRAARIAEAEAQ